LVEDEGRGEVGHGERSERKVKTCEVGKNVMLAARNGLLKGALTSLQKGVQVESLYHPSSGWSCVADRVSSVFLQLDRSIDHGDIDRDR
jgi:hypothetical protein